MKKLTRKLFISILSMAFAVIAIGTTTFAWITISTTAEVEAFDASVEAGVGGIELSWNGTDWTTLLKSAEDHFNEATGLNEFAGFSDICYDGNGFYDIEIAGQTAKKVEGAADTSKYVTFTFHIKNTNATQGITVKVKGTTFDSYASDGTTPASGFTSDIDFSYKSNGKDGDTVAVNATNRTVNQFIVANAARMMISAANSSNKVIYENAAVAGGNTGQLNIDEKFGAAHAYFLAKQYNFDTGLTKSSYSTQYNNTEFELCTLAGGDSTTVTVTIWIEGWDNECHANILSQVLRSSISLEAAPAPSAPVQGGE